MGENMTSSRIQAFANRVGTTVRVATVEERMVMAEAGIPDALVAIIATQWFDSYSDIDGVEIYDLASICEELRDTFTKHLPSGGYLPMGKAGNGDILVIDFSQAALPVGYIRLGSWPARESPPKKSFVIVSDTLDEFLKEGGRRSTMRELIQRRPRFPQDSYDAEDRRANQC
jgi:hypothetical protein